MSDGLKWFGDVTALFQVAALQMEQDHGTLGLGYRLHADETVLIAFKHILLLLCASAWLFH